MLHFVMSYMKQNRIRKQTLESAQNGLEIIFENLVIAKYCASQINYFIICQPLVSAKNLVMSLYVPFLQFNAHIS